MIQTVYPEYIQVQLDQIDEHIEQIYSEVLKECENKTGVEDVKEVQRIRRCLYERIRPYLDEKVRLVQSCCPKYVVTIDGR